MTTSRKGKAPERPTSSQSTSKRKLEDSELPASSVTKKPNRSIPELLSSQQSSESEEFPRNGRRRGKRSKRDKSSSRDKPSPNSFMDMYSFPSTKTPVNGVVDLTGNSSPENHKRNPSFSARRISTFNPHQGPKKFVVKNLRTTPRVDPKEYFEKVWSEQDETLDAVFSCSKVSRSLEELYKGAEHVCRQGRAPELYKRLKAKCKNHLAQDVRKSLIKVASESVSADVELLRAFAKAWSTWRAQLLSLRQIFLYMDQSYLLRSLDNPNITETGYILFREEVAAQPELKERILDDTIELMDRDRQGTISEEDGALLRKAVDFLHELAVYTDWFEPVFKTSSEKYFRYWKEELSGKPDLSQYAPACSSLFVKEMTRCDLLTLDRSTRAQLSELFDTVLVEEELDLLTQQDGVLQLLQNDKVTELEQLYTLLQRRGYGEYLGPTFDHYTFATGSAIVFDENNEADMVINLLNLKRRLDHFEKASFHSNEKLGNGLHKSFEAFINKTKKSQSNWDTDNAKPGEMIAKHVDLLLKGGVKAISKLAAQKIDTKPEEEHEFDDAFSAEDAEIQHHLANALDLFRFVHGKAVFEAFYKKDLARRLLMGRSASFDAERSMLTRLRNECGASFTHNLESMFKDMDLARDEMASYNQLLSDRGTKTSLDLSVNVLSAAAWPTYADVPVNIPASIQKVMNDFDKHYQTKHSGRKLAWKHSLAHCQVKAQLPRGNKELVVSGFQALVLLLFNDVASDATLTYEDIKAATGLPDAELKRTLQSLACGMYRILRKEPKGRDVNETDIFSVNNNFSADKLRIKINQIQLKETKEENKETHKRVAADRHYETQAAIVRIMKSRKKIKHNELIVEVIKATRSRGVLDQSDIKKNIDKLIEKDYMERDEVGGYNYVA